MVHFKAFRGVHPRPESKDVDDIVSVPYDVISYEDASVQGKQNAKSFLHVIRPEIDVDGDDDEMADAVYEKGRENLLHFLEHHLQRDEEKSLYVYSISLPDGYVQYGLCGELSSHDYAQNTIKRHENVTLAKLEDRKKLIYKQRANTGPLFLTHTPQQVIDEEVQAIVASQEPMLRTEPRPNDGTVHSLWKVSDPDTIHRIEQVFDHDIEALYVADGHHRAEAAFQVGRKFEEEEGLSGSFFGVVFPSDQLRIFDYNRVVHQARFPSQQEPESEEEVDQLFWQHVQEAGLSYKNHGKASDEDSIALFHEDLLEQQRKGTVLVYLKASGWTSLFLSTEQQQQEEEQSKEEKVPLDVDALSNVVLAPILGIEDLRTDKNIHFVGGVHGLISLEHQIETIYPSGIAFKMFPVSIDDVIETSDRNLLMPPKATWFEPKLLSGLLLRLYDEDIDC